MGMNFISSIGSISHSPKEFSLPQMYPILHPTSSNKSGLFGRDTWIDCDGLKVDLNMGQFSSALLNKFQQIVSWNRSCLRQDLRSYGRRVVAIFRSRLPRVRFGR